MHNRNDRAVKSDLDRLKYSSLSLDSTEFARIVHDNSRSGQLRCAE